ncbi:uncharacterized protein METZ01_LOCUS445244, partial [marine metagenome]
VEKIDVITESINMKKSEIENIKAEYNIKEEEVGEVLDMDPLIDSTLEPTEDKSD